MAEWHERDDCSEDPIANITWRLYDGIEPNRDYALDLGDCDGARFLVLLKNGAVAVDRFVYSKDKKGTGRFADLDDFVLGYGEFKGATWETVDKESTDRLYLSDFEGKRLLVMRDVASGVDIDTVVRFRGIVENRREAYYGDFWHFSKGGEVCCFTEIKLPSPFL